MPTGAAADAIGTRPFRLRDCTFRDSCKPLRRTCPHTTPTRCRACRTIRMHSVESCLREPLSHSRRCNYGIVRSKETDRPPFGRKRWRTGIASSGSSPQNRLVSRPRPAGVFPLRLPSAKETRIDCRFSPPSHRAKASRIDPIDADRGLIGFISRSVRFGSAVMTRLIFSVLRVGYLEPPHPESVQADLMNWELIRPTFVTQAHAAHLEAAAGNPNEFHTGDGFDPDFTRPVVRLRPFPKTAPKRYSPTIMNRTPIGSRFIVPSGWIFSSQQDGRAGYEEIGG